MIALSQPTKIQTQEIFLTKSGKLKSRFSWEEKLRILDPSSEIEKTEARIKAFQDLFGFRYTGGITTKVGEGPRSWRALRGRLTQSHIVRHLLADRIPTQAPLWVGARSFAWSYWICIDVDAERTKEQQVADENDVDRMDDDMYQYVLARQPSPRPKPSLESRCQQVEQAFASMGINSRKRNEVLVQRTPSGGFHYYLFFDNAYSIDQYQQLLLDAGLYHKPGEIELFPSTKQGLRLPFGHIPGRPDRPNAWIEFIDRYRFGRIKRHSLEELNESLCESNYTSTTTISQPKPQANTKRPLTTKLGQPKNDRKAVSRTKDFGVETICSFAEAEELLAVGIQAKGTRNHILNQLTAHLIWFKNLSAEEAAAILIAWALDPRHNSEDIAYDLDCGTDRVEKQIMLMCRWYESTNQNEVRFPGGRLDARSCKFTKREINSLHDFLANLPENERREKAQFVLHFLNFAKRHGNITEDNKAWESSPAVKQIIRRWPGCHHMNYKPKIDWAVETGLLEMTKDKWQRPNGKGRARTYRMNVAPDAKQAGTIDYESALELLTKSEPLDPPVEKKSQSTNPEEHIVSGEPNASKQNDPDRKTQQHAKGLATTLRPESPKRHMGTRTHKRDKKRDAVTGLLGQNHGKINTVPPGRFRQRRHHSRKSQIGTDRLSDYIEFERNRLGSHRTFPDYPTPKPGSG